MDVSKEIAQLKAAKYYGLFFHSSGSIYDGYIYKFRWIYPRAMFLMSMGPLYLSKLRKGKGRNYIHVEQWNVITHPSNKTIVEVRK